MDVIGSTCTALPSAREKRAREPLVSVSNLRWGMKRRRLWLRGWVAKRAGVVLVVHGGSRGIGPDSRYGSSHRKALLTLFFIVGTGSQYMREMISWVFSSPRVCRFTALPQM